MYTREQALACLRRNHVEIKSKKGKDHHGDTITRHYISTQGLGIKLQGVADRLINHYYDYFRA